MTRPLLAATDLSSASHQALERAAQLAAQHACPLTLQHVLSLGALERLRGLISHNPEELHERLRGGARQELEQLAAQLAERHGASIGLHLSEGPVCEEILGYADALDPALLVVGAHGERPLHHGLLGSTTERLLHASTRSLLVVKRAPNGPYRRVLVPVDFSPRSLPTLREAHRLAPQAELVVLHAYEIPFENKLLRTGMSEDEFAALLLDMQQRASRQLDRLIEDSGLPRSIISRSLLHGEPGRRVIEQQHERHCDLILLGRRDLNRLQSWLLGSVGTHVLAQADCDVLLVNGRGE